LWNGRKVISVHSEILDPKTQEPTGVRLTVKPKLTVVSGGAINTPGLLMRSGLDGRGNVGKRMWLHPTVLTIAEMPFDVNPFAGAPQSVYSHHFSERGAGKVGFFLEVPPVHPMLASIVSSGTGAQIQELFSNFQRLQVMIALQIDGLLPEETGGTVRLRDGARGRYSMSYDFTPAIWESIRTSTKEMAKLQFAVGAKRVLSLHLDPVVMNSPADIDRLDSAPWEPVRSRIFSAHQMGGCAMGKNPAKSVVDQNLRYHSLDNLYIVDGSVLPTALGVNPQETIFGIAHWAADHIGKAV
jgi:choline dehydrogenase-like flavoprotein